MKNRESVFHNIRGIDYHFNLWGNKDATPILYLHGWADSGSTFQFVVDSFKKNWRVIAPDFRGFGRSQHNKSSYWFPDYLADLNRIINIFSEKDPITLIGHSMGGNVASMYAGIFPDEVKNLINIEGFGLKESNSDNAPINYYHWIKKQNSDQKFSEYKTFDELADKLLKRNPKMSKDVAMYVANEWAMKHESGLIKLRADPFHKLPNAVQYRRNEAEACWKLIRANMIFIFGKNTNFIEQLDTVNNEERSSIFSNSQMVEIPDAGHMIHLENPELLASTIEDFLS